MKIRSDSSNRLLTSGRFAKLCGVSKQTLLFYEKLGLFMPSYKDLNGRRYYDPDQIDTFHVILALKNIMPLGEVKEYILSRNKDSFLKLYRQSIKNLSSQIALMEQQRMMMIQKMSIVNEANHIDRSLIYTQYCHEEHLKLYMQSSGRSKDSDLYASVIQYRIDHNINLGRAIGGILPVNWIYDCKDDPGYIGYYCEYAEGSNGKDYFTKPAGNYLVFYHCGDYRTTYLSYPKIAQYAEQNSLKLGKYVFEESIIDETVELDPADYITKISISFTH